MNVEDVYLLSGTSPPAIKWDACVIVVERPKQSNRDTHSWFGRFPATKCMKSAPCQVYNPQTSQQKLLDTANSGRDFVINRTYASLTFTKRWWNVTRVHGPRKNPSTVCARGTFAAKHFLNIFCYTLTYNSNTHFQGAVLDVKGIIVYFNLARTLQHHRCCPTHHPVRTHLYIVFGRRSKAERSSSTLRKNRMHTLCYYLILL